MREYSSLCLLILGFLPLIANGCATLGEGADGYLTCGNSNVQNHVTFQLQLNGQMVNISTCRVDGTCLNFRPGLAESELIVSNGRKSNRLHINRVDKSQTIWRCLIDTRIAGVCRLDVFVSPARPTCSAPEVNQASSQVSLTCRTPTVYPAALCEFFHRGDDFTQTVSGSVSYTVTDSTVSAGNKATECTIVMSLSALTRRSYQFAVNMRAQVIDTSKARSSKSDYLCPFYPDTANAPLPPPDSQCQNGLDPETPTTFGTKPCGAIEVGGTGVLSCGTTTGNVENSIRFELWENAAFRLLTSCTPQGQCRKFNAPNYLVDFSRPSEGRLQQQLQIVSLDISQTIFRCSIDRRVSGICEIDAFVRPAKPTCEAPVMSADNSEVVLTCRTRQVFPRATCRFYYGTTSLAPASGEINYVESLSPDNAQHKQTECSIRIPAHALPASPVRFQVRMHPDVSTGSVPSVFSDQSPPFTLSH